MFVEGALAISCDDKGVITGKSFCRWSGIHRLCKHGVVTVSRKDANLGCFDGIYYIFLAACEVRAFKNWLQLPWVQPGVPEGRQVYGEARWGGQMGPRGIV